MIKASIIGATGYTGQELVRMLLGHPEVKITGLGSQNYVNKQFADVYPHFRGVISQDCRGINDPELTAEADVVFLALPHGLSAPLAADILKQGKKVIDLGADFRLKSSEVYTRWYKTEAPPPEQLARAVYGLPEINREAIKNTVLTANPGCYPTTAIIALTPLLKEKMIDPGLIIIDSKSGVSGAGRGLSLTTHFCEVDEDFKAYGLPHRHTPEIEQELSGAAGQDIKVSFTPHLLPLIRGMLSTIYTVSNNSFDPTRVQELYSDYYAREPFVRILPPGELPHTKWVQGTNYCDLGFSWDERTGRLTILSAIDNLVKGASGQAIQNMNLMCGLEETRGLSRTAIYP